MSVSSELTQTCQTYLNEALENAFEPDKIKNQMQFLTREINSLIHFISKPHNEPSEHLKILKDWVASYLREVHKMTQTLENYHYHLYAAGQMTLSSNNSPPGCAISYPMLRA